MALEFLSVCSLCHRPAQVKHIVGNVRTLSVRVILTCHGEEWYWECSYEWLQNQPSFSGVIRLPDCFGRGISNMSQKLEGKKKTNLKVADLIPDLEKADNVQEKVRKHIRASPSPSTTNTLSESYSLSASLSPSPSISPSASPSW